MIHRANIFVLALLALVFAGGRGLAFQASDQPALPDFDARPNSAAGSHPLSAPHAAGVNRLKSRYADLQIGMDEILRRPGFVSRPNGFLTEKSGGDPRRIVQAFLDGQPEIFGHDASALTNALVTRDAVTRHNGLRTTVWQQQFAGIPVFEGVLSANVTRDGELVTISSRFVPTPAQAAGSSRPKLTAGQGAAQAAQSLGAADIFAGGAKPKLIWLPINETELRLCWDVTLTVKARGETFRLLVDAQTGEILIRRCQTVYLANASYNVLDRKSTRLNSSH